MTRTLRWSKSYFNPRSREGSDFWISDSAREIFISIHAPAKGATVFPDNLRFLSNVSIHAPAKGATQLDAIP